jgi:prepilin peptidase CpaA
MHPDQIMSLLPPLALGLALAAAVWHDVRARRIPNSLIAAGTLAAILLHLLMPAGEGLFRSPAGSPGLVSSLLGFAFGLLLLLPFYAMQALGAGDVKLMALVGAFVGPAGVAGATLLSMLAGGFLAIAVALWCGQLRPVIGNVGHMLRSVMLRAMGGVNATLDAPASTTGKLAYAVAIACGTVLHLTLRDWPAWRLFS